jgi:hypothetical protein
MHQLTLARRETALAHRHPDTLISISNLAGVLDSQGRGQEAELLNRQTLAGRTKFLGASHPDTHTSINNLAVVLAI